MDLMAQHRTDLAYTFLNTWLEESGDYAGLAVLRFYLVHPCMVLMHGFSASGKTYTS